MKTVIFIIIVLFFQIGILPHLAILGTFPNIILSSLISLSILRGFRKSVIWIIATGLFLDFYSLSGVIGIFVVSMLFCTYFAIFLSRGVFKKSNLLSIIPIFLLVIVFFNFSVLGLQIVFGLKPEFKALIFLVNVVYNTIFAIPVFYLIKKYAGKSKQI